MVRCGTDVRSHGDGREEIGSTPLHVDALQGIGIIAYPEFIEIRQTSPVGASPTAGTSLDGQVRIFGTDALAYFFESAVIFDVHVALVVFGQIVRTMVHDTHVGIPFDVIDFRIASHQIIYYLENEILNLRIGQVEYYLCTTTPQYRFTLRRFQNPVRMFFVKFAGGIRHFRLNPDTEVDTMLFRIAEQSLDSFGKFPFVDNPIAQRGIVRITWVFVSEPSVVHHKQFAAHRSDVAHHLVHTGLVDVEVDTFPAVQQNLAWRISMGQSIATSPTVEITAGTAQPLLTVGQG